MRGRAKPRDKYKPFSRIFSGNRRGELLRSRPGLAWELLVEAASQWLLFPSGAFACVKLLFALFSEFVFTSALNRMGYSTFPLNAYKLGHCFKETLI